MIVGKVAVRRRASSCGSSPAPAARLSAPAAMRRAYMAGTRRRAASRNSSKTAAGRALRLIQRRRKASSSPAVGRSPCHSSQVISSNEARGAISSTGKPAKSSTPASPSTLLKRVVAATTPSNPSLIWMLSIVGSPFQSHLRPAFIRLSILIRKSMYAVLPFGHGRPLSDRTGGRRGAGDLAGDALRLRQPGDAPLGAGAGQAAGETLPARGRAAAQGEEGAAPGAREGGAEGPLLGDAGAGVRADADPGRPALLPRPGRRGAGADLDHRGGGGPALDG